MPNGDLYDMIIIAVEEVDRQSMAPVVKQVKTSPFHGGNTGSIPVGVIYADVAQLAEQLICNQQVIGSSPIIGLFLGKNPKYWFELSWLEQPAHNRSITRFESPKVH